MINMQMTQEEAKSYASPMETGDAPKYPWGLCIDLCDESLKKLGITQLPTVGQTMTLSAKVVVTSTGATQQMDGDKESRMSLQITDMELQSATPQVPMANRLYGED